MSLVLTLAAAAHAGTIIVPGAQADTEGNSNNGFPFNIDGFARTSMRYQQLYGASAFSGLISITGIDFRREQDADTFSATLPSIQIDLSTATGDALADTFADNVGADDVIVFAMGPLALSSSSAGPAGGPEAFDIHIQFTTPFLYDPSKGSLLLDIRNFGGGTTVQFDSQNSPSDAVSRLFSGDVADTRGNTDSEGLVTRFDFEAASTVPEPATGAIAALALLCIGVPKYRSWFVSRATSAEPTTK